VMARKGVGAVRAGCAVGRWQRDAGVTFLPPSRSDLNAWIDWVPRIRANGFMSSPDCTGCMADLGPAHLYRPMWSARVLRALTWIGHDSPCMGSIDGQSANSCVAEWAALV